MPLTLFAGLGENALLVLALVAAYGVVVRRESDHPLRQAGLVGVLFGAMSVAAMAMPVHLAPGIQMDGRALLVSAGAAFGGPIAGVLSAGIAVAFRLHLGGAGAAYGVLGITLAALGGTIFYHYASDIRRLPWHLGFLALGIYDAASFVVVTVVTPAAFLAKLPAAYLTVYWLVMPPVMWAVGALLAHARREQQKRLLLEATLETMGQGLLVFDKDLCLRARNRRAVELLDLPADLATAQPAARDLLHLYIGHDSQAAPSRTEHARPEGTVLELEHAQLPDGGVIIVCTDVTERRRAEETLKQSEQRFRDFAEVSSDCFWETDADLRYTWFSEDGCTASEWSPEWHSGKTRLDVLASGTDREAVASHVADLEARRPYKDFVFKRHDPDGDRWIRSSGRPVFDPDGTFLGYRGTGTDVTVQMRMESALVEAKEEAVEASLAKSRFLANMSHELRTPLNAVIGFSEMIEQAMFGPVDARYKEYAGDIRKSGQFLLDLINTVLDLAKIEAGKAELFDETVELHGLVMGVRKLVGTAHRVPEDMIVVELAAPTPVRADARMVRQMLLNLLSNAVKFTPADGRITVAARAAPDGGLLLSIADTGSGMDERDLSRALRPFEQADTPFVRNREGTGLGLPLTKAMIELHGGTLTIQSAPGEGTTITLGFPAARIVSDEAACLPNESG